MTELRDLIKDPTAAELALVAAYGALPEDARRQRAFEAFAATGLPHRRVEAFKWTDFRRALNVLPDGSGARPDAFAGLEGHVIRFANGAVEGLDNLPNGLNAFVKEEGQALGAAEQLPIGAMTAALVGKTVLFEVTEKVVTPIRLVFEGAGELALARASFIIRPGAELTVIESHLGGAGFNTSLLEFGLQAGAKVSRTLIQPSSPDEAVAITAQVHLDGEAEYTQTALAFGAKVARIETRVMHQETGAKATINGGYLAGPDHHVDFTSFVRHGAVECETEQRTKGAVLDGGEGVFQGKFFVPRGVGQRTSADMQHNALLLEDGAVVNAKPELEIYADDVECAHGNTCGALDAEALFYMRQRGIPEATARALLTEAFIGEALETAPDAAREVMLTAARNWLAA